MKLNSYSTNGIFLVDFVLLEVVELVQLVGQGANLTDACLVRSKIAEEGLVLLLQGNDPSKVGVGKVLSLQRLGAAVGPGIMPIDLVLEALSLVLAQLVAASMSEHKMKN